MKRSRHLPSGRGAFATCVCLLSSLLAACIAPAQESEARIDAPIRLQFEVSFGSTFGDRDDGGWPELSLVLSAADAEMMGSGSTSPFVYVPYGREALAQAVVTATNYVVETEDHRLDVPCFTDPVVAVVAETGTRVVVQEIGFCPTGAAFESISIDADRLVEAVHGS